MGKAADNKQQKRDALLNTAFSLFTTKGLHNTSISDIVEQAGVAKGTFYLYFKDKYDINNKLVVHRATMLFDAAMARMKEHDLKDCREKLLFIIDDIIDALTENKLLLMFISKNLGLGFFRFTVENAGITEHPTIHNAYQVFVDEIGDTVQDPKLMLYLIIELIGGSIYSSILYEQPVSITELKPHLYKTINGIIDQFSSGS
ncbi:MAG: TetR/AcrR family transcriptional regulator [Lachnospiraceae bacterium]|nr:TetR/AcrR family transcriptional regulator [Lachnospiraceae bacterium]